MLKKIGKTTFPFLKKLGTYNLSICSENSFIIHSRSYGETSVIFDVITENIGLYSLLGKGIKKKKDFSSLQPFKELKLTFSNKKNLPILSKYEIVNTFQVSKNNLILYGMYMNELIYKFIPQREPCISLYKLYKYQLNNMSDNRVSLDLQLLKFEILFLKEIGYEITSAISKEEISDSKNYYYQYDSGFKEVNNKLDLNLSITGGDLKLLIGNSIHNISKVNSLRSIVRNIFQRLLGTKKIMSYELFD